LFIKRIEITGPEILFLCFLRLIAAISFLIIGYNLSFAFVFYDLSGLDLYKAIHRGELTPNSGMVSFSNVVLGQFYRFIVVCSAAVHY